MFSIGVINNEKTVFYFYTVFNICSVNQHYTER